MEPLLRDPGIWRSGRRVFQLKSSKNRLWLLVSNERLPCLSVFSVHANDLHVFNNPSVIKPLLRYDDSNFHFNRIPIQNRRGMAFLVGRVVRGVFKLRYLILGGAVTGGYTLHQTYQRWLDAIPDMSWIDKYTPKTEDWESVRKSFLSVRENMAAIKIDSELKDALGVKFSNMREWMESRLEDAKRAAAAAEGNELENKSGAISVAANATTVNALSFANGSGKTEQEKVTKITEEDIWEIHTKYQNEIERLEKENKALRKQIMLSRTQSSQPVKKIKAALIDMYSDVLDELNEFDANFKNRDQLPRVVVIGDQSSGKTSVLEMIAQARIFPRGAGEMMTRAPVNVTLSEGPYHIAQFKDSSREFDLTNESDLADLRREVENRMRNLCVHKTVSNDVISMTVKGPGLQRMVLVDLPGIISTNTLNMADDTKQSIYEMAKQHMSNPNAIILCIQDGAVDAERSNVTDLVSQMDPNGKRTIFVLTKIDLAEAFNNPERIKKILAGELFPMKALGYYAVITGRGSNDDSIQKIKEYEEKFFRNSKLFNGQMIKKTHLTTRNLSMAVSECFWKMVRETIEQQADAFKALRFNLETEWKNSFPRMRMLDRNELFDKARGEILDDVINFGDIGAKQWEDRIVSTLWKKISDHFFEKILLPASDTENEGSFNTYVGIQLSQWTNHQLSSISVEAGWETLIHEFQAYLEKDKDRKDHDSIFDSIKKAVLEEAIRRHKWDKKAVDTLRVLQLNSITDEVITDKDQWDAAIRFMETCVKEKLKETKQKLKELTGPGSWEQWYAWKYQNDDQRRRNAVKHELEVLLNNVPNHGLNMSEDEMKAVRNILQRYSVNCTNEFIESTWNVVYRKHFYQTLLDKTHTPNSFFLYRQGIDVQDYRELVLFWRVQQMSKVTVNALRQQIMNTEAPRMDNEIKGVLEEFGQDHYKKQLFLTGRRVTLAEELKRVKQIQEKLEEFITALSKEKQERRRS